MTEQQGNQGPPPYHRSRLCCGFGKTEVGFWGTGYKTQYSQVMSEYTPLQAIQRGCGSLLEMVDPHAAGQGQDSTNITLPPAFSLEDEVVAIAS